MRADLVGAAGFQAAFDERSRGPSGRGAGKLAEAFHGPIMRDRVFAGVGVGIAGDDVFAAIVVGAQQNIFDPRRAFRRGAARDGVIDALDGVFRELHGEAVVRDVVLGDDDEAGGVFVDAVHDAGAGDAVNA